MSKCLSLQDSALHSSFLLFCCELGNQIIKLILLCKVGHIKFNLPEFYCTVMATFILAYLEPFLAFVTVNKLPNLSVREIIGPISRVAVKIKSGQDWDFPSGLVARILCSQCRASGFDLWLGNQIPHAATKDSTCRNKYQNPTCCK